MKITPEIIHEAASKLLDGEKTNQLIKDIEELANAEAEAEKEGKEPTVKKQFVVLLYDKLGCLTPEFFKASGFDGFTATVCQIPEDDDTGTTLDRLIRASYEFNVSKKGRRYPVKTIGESCEAVGARFLKEQGIAIKTKIPVRVIVTDNKLPEIESDF